jgi:hypothetical protein
MCPELSLVPEDRHCEYGTDHPLTGHKSFPPENSEAGNHSLSFVRAADAA